MAYDDALAGRIQAAVAGEPGLTEKRMFGGLAFLINGNMAVSASGQGGLLLRVDPTRTEALVSQPGVARAVMRGRALEGWLRVETADLGDEDLARWIDVGVTHARSMPPK